ncbi:MAG: hypothetical protein J7J02_00860 [Sulfurovum sp.]|nr:hypothetical protein [Sulfurovum sp.]
MKRNTLHIILLGTALLFVGCTPQPVVEPAKKVVKKPKAKAKKRYKAPKAPKKNIKLKEVEDTNFSSEYMYPETKTKKAKPVTVAKADTTEPVTPAASTSNMSRGECISMIGQEKFDKYTQMLGDEASAIKRCKMLKAM